MARKVTLKELEEREQKRAEELKELRAEIRKARAKEIARIKKEQKEKEVQEALALIELSKKLTLTVADENGSKRSVTFYDRLKELLDKQ